MFVCVLSVRAGMEQMATQVPQVMTDLVAPRGQMAIMELTGTLDHP